jgi:O-antigen/teichoic acid export membrane protein
MQAGAAWMVAFKLADRSLGFISTLVLARLLVPADFGIVAMATSVLALIEMFSAFGLDVALIRSQVSDREHFDSAWTLNVLIGVAICILLLLASPLAAAFYRQPALQAAIAVLAVGPLLQGFENIGVVAFRRELRFNAEFGFLIGKRLVQLACVIPLAFLLRNWWALIAGILMGKLAGLVLSYVVHPYRPRFSLARAGDFMRFSKWVMFVNAIAYFLQRSPDLIIGPVAGARALGLYSVSAELGNLPTTELIAPVNRAVYPAYARLGHDRPALRREYLSVMGAIALLGAPAAIGVVATAKFLVPVLLGAKWLDAIPLVELFGLFGMTQILQTNIYAVYLSIGKPQLQVVIHFLQFILLAIGLGVLSHSYGAYGAALATLCAGAAVLPVNLALVFRQLDVRIGQLLALIWRPLGASLIMLLAIRMLFSDEIPASTGAAISSLSAAVATGVVVYVCALLALWSLVGRPEGAERWLIGKGVSAVRRLGFT